MSAAPATMEGLNLQLRALKLPSFHAQHEEMAERAVQWLAVVQDSTVVGLIEKDRILRAQESDGGLKQKVADLVGEQDVCLVWDGPLTPRRAAG